MASSKTGSTGGEGTGNREDVIETLIDMDPCGAAYRVSKTMNEAPSFALQGRHNRIPDSALFDAASALSKYEILPSSPQVMGDLLQQQDGLLRKSDENSDTLENMTDAATTPNSLDIMEKYRTKDAEERILRHHDKIIRAKNSNHKLKQQQQQDQGQQQLSDKLPATTDSGDDNDDVTGGEEGNGGNASSSSSIVATTSSDVANTTSVASSPASNVTTNAVPPPQLVSALRQIFGTASSTNLEDLMTDTSTDNDDKNNNNIIDKNDNNRNVGGDNDNDAVLKRQHSENVNVLPSLLAAVLNHETFVGPPAPTTSKETEWPSSITESEAVSQIKRDLKNFFGAEFDEEEEEENERSLDNDEGIEEGTKTSMDGKEEGIEESKPPTQLPPGAANMEAIIGSVCKSMLNKSDKSSPTKSHIHGLLIAILSILTGCLLSEEDLENLGPGDSHLLLQHQHLPTSTLDVAGNSDSSFLQVGAVLSMLRNSSSRGGSDIVKNHDNNVLDEFSLDEKLLNYFADASATYEERIEIQKANLVKVSTPGVSKAVEDDEKAGHEQPTQDVLPPLVGRVSDSSDESDGDDTDVDQIDVNRRNSEDRIEEGNDILPIFDEGNNEDQNSSNSDEEHDEGDSSASRNSESVQEGGNDRHDSDGGDDDSENDVNNDDEDDESMMLRQALALSLAAAIGSGVSVESDADADADEGGSTSAATPPIAPRRDSEESDSCSEKCSNSDNLPPLPTPPPLSLLPTQENIITEAYEEDDENEPDKSNSSQTESSSVFDPSALSSFGNLPASQVLLHLQGFVLDILQNCCKGVSEEFQSGLESMMSPGGMGSPFFGSQTPKSRRDEAGEQDAFKDDFKPDSITASLLFASLHLSNYLRNAAVAMLSDIVEDTEEMVEDYRSGVHDVGNQGIKIANSNDSDDPLTDVKEDPAIGATLDSFESKGMQRKAAAAAHFATLRHETKQKLVLLWSKKVSLYSSCCLLSMRCLRIFMGRCIQSGVNSSGIEDAVCMSARTRLGLAAILSNFYSSSTSSSFEQLQHSISHFSEDYKAAGGGPKNQFLVASLCSEAILLWGESLSFLYPDHMARVDLLSELIRNRALPSAKSLIDSINSADETQNIFRWSDNEIQCSKLDLLCKRLRMSDMLDYFVESPMLSFGEEIDLSDDKTSIQTSLQACPPDNSISTISVLSDAVKDYSRDDNITQLYLAVCNRTMSNLILWQNLSISSNDENDHDISGGEASTASSETWSNTLQLSLNSSKFHFDSTKCADSIAIISSASLPGVTANQRATKVWGTVLSTACFLPKSGIHRWAIKLEKCERGHVFVGVATSSASTKTYVGGDKHGWGLIGTQALWHDRNKIRSDYGSTFRSGATIVITLDTNVGTLRFGLWKEAAGAECGPLSPSHGTAQVTSPRVGATPGNGVSMIEDWGIAFEGLPLDVKLYPAVGLYQRDDKATLFAVSNPTKSSSGKPSSSAISSGEIYFPLPTDAREQTPDHMLRVQRWNQSLCTDGIAFCSEVLSRSIQILSSPEPESSLQNDILLTSVLPSLASSICLIPSCIPTLSTKYAITLLPLITRCANLLDGLIPLENKTDALGSELKEGNWLLRIEPPTDSSRSNNMSEEYVVCLKQNETPNSTGYICFRGKGIDTSSRSKDGNVTITAACCGTHLHLIEDWSGVPPTSCIIDARLGLDGTKFEGTYHDTKQHASGRVFGYLQDNITTRVQTDSTSANNKQLLQTIESLLCMAIGHLSLILCSKTSLSDIDRRLCDQVHSTESPEERRELFHKLLNASSIIAGGRIDYDRNRIRTAVDSLVERCCLPNTIDHEKGDNPIVQHWQDLVHLDVSTSMKESSANASVHIEKARAFIEHLLASESQCSGSFSRLCPDEYSASQQQIASVILYHSCGYGEIDTSTENSAVLGCAVKALSTSRQILENGIRDALSKANGLPHKQVCKSHCSQASAVADFLTDFPCLTSGDGNSSQSVFDDVTLIFNNIKSKEDLSYVRNELDSVTEKSIMRYLGLRSLHSLLAGGIKLHAAIESAIVSLPRLLKRPTGNCFSPIYSGCSRSVQEYLTASVKLLYGRVGVYLEEATQQVSSSLVLSLLANYSTVSYPNDMEGTISKMIPCIGDIIVHCREEVALCDGNDSSPSTTTLVSALRRRSAHCLLQVTASVLLTLTAQLSACQERDEKTNLIRMSSDLLLREMSEMIPVVRESVSLRGGNNNFKAMKVDWRVRKNLTSTTSRSSKADFKNSDSSPGVSYLLSHNYTMASKAASTEPMSSCYLSHLINTLHIAVRSTSFITSMKMRSKEWFCVLFSLIGIDEDEDEINQRVCLYLNPKLRCRILRLLRLMLIETDADPVIIRHLLRVAGPIGGAEAEVAPSDFATNDSIVSLLRYLYAFSDAWRQIIYQVIEEEWGATSKSQTSSELRFGVLSFLGGAPGNLAKGSFVVIKPNLASSSSSVSTKARAGGGGTSSLNVSTGNGIDEVVSGLSRNVALAGILSSVDLKSGSCEVVVVGDRDIEQSPTFMFPASSGGSKMTIRAVRVNVADISFVNELPLLIRSDMPVDGMYRSLLDRLKAVSLSILSQASSEENECSEQVNTDDMFTCAMGLRSTAVLTSDKSILCDFVSDKQGCFKEFFAVCLQVACPGKTKTKGELSSLSSLEALAWHLLTVRSALMSRMEALKNAEPSQLKFLFGQDEGSSAKPNAATDRLNTRADSSRTPSAMRSFLGSLSEGLGSTAASRNTRDEEESDSAAERQESEESADMAAAHLREAAIVQMAELGLPRQWAELALRRVGGTNIEAAVHFCLERGGDMERLLAEDHERRGSSSVLSSSRRRGFGPSRMDASNLIRQLVEMGFPRRWCVEALSATRNNVDEALTWILTNGERLSAEDEAAEEENEDDDDDDDDEENEEEEEDEEENQDDESASDENVEPPTAMESSSGEKELSPDSKKPLGWSGSLCPVRFVSGRSRIDSKTLEITGLPSGGFSSVGTKGVLLTSGKWYYEAEIQTAGCIQIGWADSSFVGHCQADRGDGVGDGPSSWAFDGWRRYRWHSTPTEWGCRWAEGDVVGCLVDMDSMTISFTLNGKGEEIGMGLAYSGEGFRPCSGVYACVSFNRKEKIRLILGGDGTEPFNFPPPEGYRGVGEAIHDAVKERDSLMQNEQILGDSNLMKDSDGNRYICDFSDGEHGHELFAWQHRYYGADASVHLGASRAGSRGGSTLKSSKSGSSASSNDDTPVSADIASRLAKLISDSKSTESNDDDSDTVESNVEILKASYGDLLSSVENEFKEVCTSLCVLYAQKLVMHTMVSCSDTFSLNHFLPEAKDTPWTSKNAEEEVSRTLWKVVEHCTSLRSSGWVGEAGAMAVAAEALGLGISTFDNTSTSTAPGLIQVNDQTLIPSGGTVQFLSSALFLPKDVFEESSTCPSLTYAACSEVSLGSDASGYLSFTRSSLQNAAVTSSEFRGVLVAAIRRAVRLIASAEFDSDEHSSEDDSSELASPSNDRRRLYSDDDAPDARLASFLTGLLISEPVKCDLSEEENTALRCSLFEGWSVGLLSPSPPWRMVSALTAAGILSTCPVALSKTILRVPVLARYFSRLENTVARRQWAERAATPICSRYAHALIELLSSVKRSIRLCGGENPLSPIRVDAATPLPLVCSSLSSDCESWEWNDGWISSNTGWETWTGFVDIMEVEWKPPSRSIVRTLMDGGEGPPLLREGCTVMRGGDWDNRNDADNEDGKDEYDQEKLAKEEEKRAADEEKKKQKGSKSKAVEGKEIDPAEDDDPADDKNSASDVDHNVEVGLPELPPKESDEPPSAGVEAAPSCNEADELRENDDSELCELESTKKKKKLVTPKLPTGTVLSIEPWEGIPAMARRVRWHRTGKEGVYRYGGNGGRFDLVHVEANDKNTRVRKKHPPPESLEQCAARYGFGKRRKSNVILRLSNRKHANADNTEKCCDGIMEWPDFGAGVLVECTIYPDGAVAIKEKRLLYGSKDSGWETRFGQSSYVPGTEFVVMPTLNEDPMSSHEELLGDSTFLVKDLRRKEDGGRVRVTSELHLYRGKGWKIKSGDISDENVSEVSPMQSPLICFDSDFHSSSFSLSKDKRTVTCVAADGRGIAYGNVGFTKGVHYWEVKLEKAEIGSVYIGVAEKPESTSGGFETQPRLNRWLGWGFVNFRATYSAGVERVYGAHCHAGDTVGVLLDCDAGRISYFFDGVKYGEHILNDLGCAFENVSPFGFNADGCGSGGAGQGAPSGVDGGRNNRYPANGAVRPKAMWPVIGLRHPGDRVTMSAKCMTSHGIDAFTVMKNSLAVDEILCAYEKEYTPQIPAQPELTLSTALSLPPWFVEESLQEYKRWKSGRWLRTSTRGSGQNRLSSYGLDVDLDTSPLACAAACASLGLSIALLCGDRVDVKRSSGRILELQEEAVVLGAYQGRLFYRLVSQKSEGGSLMEGGGRAWFWDESEAVEGGLQLIGEGRGRSVELPKLSRFNPSCGGLKVVYTSGAVVRSDLEIFDGSENLGNIPLGTIIPAKDIIERRLNSCGVARYLINHEDIGRGWISGRIRGGKEESIVEVIPFGNDNDDGDNDGDVNTQPKYLTPEESANEWYKHYVAAGSEIENSSEISSISESLDIESLDEFQALLSAGKIHGLKDMDSDSLIASVYGKLVDVLPHFSEGVECSFIDCATVLASVSPQNQVKDSSIDANVHEVASEALVHVMDRLPPTKALMARIAMLRALNRRAHVALPWLPMRPSQEGSCIFGGLHGFGASLERAGRTWDSKSTNKWAQVTSVASRFRNCRELFFTGTKKTFLEGVMDATTTPTPLSNDEYELPRDVRTLRVNRLKARRAMTSNDNNLKRKHSVFSQMQREMRGWSGATLRRGFVAKGHGGQKRAFKVKLVGEGVNDYSGPYREVFTDTMQEVTDLDDTGSSSLGVLEPTANNRAEVGEGRDLFMFARPSDSSSIFSEAKLKLDQLSNEEIDLLKSFSSIAHKKNESAREIEEALLYLGRLAGTACRHGIPVDLPLPLGMVWKRLTEESIDTKETLREMDILASRRLQDGTDHNATLVTDELLATQRRLLNSFAEGISSVLPVELLSAFTGEQLRDIMCGNPDIDVEMLRRVTEYEGYNNDDNVISHFWEVLREMTTSERKLFLQFVWARNRLPLKESDFDAPFKIQKDTKSIQEDGDYPLPSASTCFFSLTLPDYPDKETLKRKLLFAIENVTTMESDYVTNDVEVGEGWRGL